MEKGGNMKKNFISFMSCFVATTFILATFGIAADENTITGNGSQDDPYLISTADELLMIDDFDNASFKLVNNIDINSWSGVIFSGTLDGDGYKITIKSADNGFIYKNTGTVKNLSIDITDETTFPALLTYTNDGIIENVHVSGSMGSNHASYMGSVACLNGENGIIRNTYSTAYVAYRGSFGSGVNCYGVFAGDNKGIIENCYWLDSSYQVDSFCGDNSGDMTGCVLGGDHGKSDAAMRLPETYDGWDFENVWKIDPDMNNGFPCHINEREFIKIPVTDIELSENELYLEPGESAVLTSNVIPDNAWNKNISWSSSDYTIASVTDDGTVTAHSVGETDITVTSEDGGFSRSCRVSVAVKATGVQISHSLIALERGESFTLQASVLPENATYRNIVWSSSRPDIVSVENGIVTGIAEGSADITARSEDGEASAVCAVNVIKPAEERYDLNSDGICDIKDAELISRYLAGHTDTGLTLVSADVNGDGKVNSRDTVDLLHYLSSNKDGDA